MIDPKILQEAEYFRHELQKGMLNIPAIGKFLEKIIGTANPTPRQEKRMSRFEQQMANLERGHARKPQI